MAAGWFIAFVLLVPVLGIQMTPPRGDNWAGSVGMVAGMPVYFEWRKLRALTLASLICGFVGGFGFASGQLLYLVFLWWMVVGNFDRSVVNFAPQRLITEGVIFLNATICTLILLPGVPATIAVVELEIQKVSFGALLKKAVVVGMLATVLWLLVDCGLTRAMYGNELAGFSAKHIRFGPNATATTEKPAVGQPHP